MCFTATFPRWMLSGGETAVDACCYPGAGWCAARRNSTGIRAAPRKALRGGTSKVNFQETRALLGQKWTSGAKNEATAPRTRLRYPHEGPFVERARHRLWYEPAAHNMCGKRVKAAERAVVLTSMPGPSWGYSKDNL